HDRIETYKQMTELELVSEQHGGKFYAVVGDKLVQLDQLIDLIQKYLWRVLAALNQGAPTGWGVLHQRF
ncbi:MAG TPA: hypothetical protein VES59_09300, partial [Bacteroidota bacterium]|nr:hypothetical protein [Bacteroidota bacterium]